jgi:hypothetical protein
MLKWRLRLDQSLRGSHHSYAGKGPVLPPYRMCLSRHCHLTRRVMLEQKFAALTAVGHNPTRGISVLHRSLPSRDRGRDEAARTRS